MRDYRGVIETVKCGKNYNTSDMWRAADYSFILAFSCHYPPKTNF